MSQAPSGRSHPKEKKHQKPTATCIDGGWNVYIDKQKQYFIIQHSTRDPKKKHLYSAAKIDRGYKKAQEKDVFITNTLRHFDRIGTPKNDPLIKECRSLVESYINNAVNSFEEEETIRSTNYSNYA